MLQGALAAVAAKAKEAKAAVGEIRDAIDNPTYDDDEEGEWSDEEGDEGGVESTRAPPPRVTAGASNGNGQTAAQPGGALAALRARLAAERERKKASEEQAQDVVVNDANEQRVEPTQKQEPTPAVKPTLHADEVSNESVPPAANEPAPKETTPNETREREPSPPSDSVSQPPTTSHASSSQNDSELASQLADAQRKISELQAARRDDIAKHVEQLKIAQQNIQLASRDLESAKYETEKKNSELEKLRQHLLAMEEEDDLKEEMLREREMELAEQAEATISNATEISESTKKAAERDVDLLREALQKKDLELANLQKALEHFDDEADDAERSVLELTALREKNSFLNAELVAERARVAAASDKVSEAEKRCTDLEKHAMAADAAAQKSVLEASRARRALAEQASQAVTLASDSSEQIDRRVLSKLLVTYFEREESGDVLELMARVLGLNDEDKRKIGVGPGAKKKKGVLGAVAAAPGRLVFGALGLAGTVAKVPVAVAEVYKPDSDETTVADQWVDFLLQQMDAEDYEVG